MFAKKVFLSMGCAMILLAGQAASARMYRIQEQEMDKKFNELLYCSNRRVLYDQKAITSTDAFKNATRVEQEAQLERHFRMTKGVALGILGSEAFAKIGLTGVLPSYLLLRIFGGQQHGAAVGMQMVTFSIFETILSMLSSEVSQNIQFLWSLLTEHLLPCLHVGSLWNTVAERIVPSGVLPYLQSSPQEDRLLPLEELEIAYVRSKPWIQPGLQKKIEDIFIGFYCEAARGFEGDDGEKTVPVDRARYALALPTETKDVIYDEKAIETALDGYSDDVVTALKLFCLRHTKASKAKSPRKAQIYFYGPHGVGKTHAVERIANVLGLPYATITLKPGLEGLFVNEKDPTKPGDLLLALTRAKKNGKGAKNMILFIDEADKVMNKDRNGALEAELLKFFNRDDGKSDEDADGDKGVDIPYLGMKIDLSRVGIILAGNEQFKSKPMRNRFRMVEFPPYTTQQKRHIVYASLLDKILDGYVAREGSQSLSKQDLDPEFIESIIAGDTEPGLREIERKIEDYVVTLDSCKERHQGDRSRIATCMRTFLNGAAPRVPLMHGNASATVTCPD